MNVLILSFLSLISILLFCILFVSYRIMRKLYKKERRKRECKRRNLEEQEQELKSVRRQEQKNLNSWQRIISNFNFIPGFGLDKVESVDEENVN